MYKLSRIIHGSSRLSKQLAKSSLLALIFSTMLSSSFASLNGTSQNNNDLNPAQTKDGTLSSYTNHSMTTASDISVTNDLQQQNAQTLDNHENIQSRENQKIELAARQLILYEKTLEKLTYVNYKGWNYKKQLVKLHFSEEDAAKYIKSVEDEDEKRIKDLMETLRFAKSKVKADNILRNWNKENLLKYKTELEKQDRSSLGNSSSTDDLLKIRAEYLKKMQYWYSDSIDSAIQCTDYQFAHNLLMQYFDFAKANDAFVDLKLVGKVIKEQLLWQSGNKDLIDSNETDLIDSNAITQVIADHYFRMMSNKSEDHNKNIILSMPDNISTETGIQVIEKQVLIGFKRLIANITKSSDIKEDLKECWTSKLLCKLRENDTCLTENTTETNKKILKMLSPSHPKENLNDNLYRLKKEENLLKKEENSSYKEELDIAKNIFGKRELPKRTGKLWSWAGWFIEPLYKTGYVLYYLYSNPEELKNIFDAAIDELKICFKIELYKLWIYAKFWSSITVLVLDGLGTKVRSL